MLVTSHAPPQPVGKAVLLVNSAEWCSGALLKLQGLIWPNTERFTQWSSVSEEASYQPFTIRTEEQTLLGSNTFKQVRWIILQKPLFFFTVSKGSKGCLVEQGSLQQISKTGWGDPSWHRDQKGPISRCTQPLCSRQTDPTEVKRHTKEWHSHCPRAVPIHAMCQGNYLREFSPWYEESSSHWWVGEERHTATGKVTLVYRVVPAYFWWFFFFFL